MLRRRPPHRCALPVLCAVLATCGGGGTDASSGGNGTISVSVTPTTLVVFQGATVTATVTVTRTNFSDALTLSDSLLPAGLTASYSPPVLTGSTLTSILSITATATATPGSGSVVTYAAGPGTESAHAGFGISIIVSRPQVAVVLAGSGTGTVTSSPAGINCAGTCTASFAPGTSVTLTATPAAGSAFGGWSSTSGVCSGTSTTCTLTVTAAPTVTATFNSTAQSFAFGLATPTAGVAQGGAGTATVNISRVNGYAGAVSFTATGAPTGVTVTANPPSVTGNTATLNIAATSAVAVGNYPVTISATGAGIAGAQAAVLNVQVTSAPGGSGNIALSFAGCDPSEVPIWVAAQIGTSSWARVNAGASNTFTFAVGATGGIALVTQGAAGFSTSVLYGSQADFMSLALGNQCRGINASTGTTRLTGTVNGGGPATHSFISVGGAFLLHPAIQGSGYTLENVPVGQRDLFAANFNNTANDVTSLNRMILRRDVTYTSSIPALSFFAGEDFIPASGRVQMSNTGADQAIASVSFMTANGATAPFMATTAAALTRVPYMGIPDGMLRPEDLHVITVTATPASGSSARVAILLRHSVTVDVDTATFGPALNQPTVTSIATSPYLRLRAQVASQAPYTAAVQARYGQTANTAGVVVTAGYSGSTPANWVLDFPDLTSAGYDPSWGLKSGSSVSWQVYAAGGSVLQLFGATPVNGSNIVAAGVANSSAAFNRLLPFKGW
jgi:List-Bact-rpt repeat protein